jgi:excisionase family DNA binding protein
MKNKFTSFDELPITISADEVAMVLGISRANAYSLMHTKGFPTIILGRRMIVPKDKFIEWIEQQVAAE